MNFFTNSSHRCGHCKTIAPHYIEAAAELKKNAVPAVMAELDATVHKNSAQKFVHYVAIIYFIF